MKVNNMKCIGAFSPSVSVQTGENIPGNVYTEDNLLAGKGIEIVDEPVEGGIDNHTLACWHFDEDLEPIKFDSQLTSNVRGKIKQDYYKFGNGSCSSPDITIMNNGLNTSDFTVDYFFMPKDYIGGNSAYIGDVRIYINGLGVIVYFNNNNIYEFSLKQYGIWTHFAIQRKDLIYTIYVNGQSVFQSTDALTTRPTTVFNADTGGNINFYIDELRISDIARPLNPDGTFPVPTKPYSLAIPTGNKVINNTLDVSSLVTKEEVSTGLSTKQDTITGSNGEVVYHNGTGVFTQSILNLGYACVSTAEVNQCKNNAPSFSDVFNTWKKFSHKNATNDAIPSEMTAWTYDSGTDTITQPLNTESYVGFISPKSYSSYDITVRCYSTGSDDDSIGLVAAFAKDSNGLEHTLSFIRSPGGTSAKWVAILDYNQFALTGTSYGQKILVNKSAASTTPSSTASWNTESIGTGTVIKMVRSGNVITAKCSQFNSNTIDDNTLITVDLDALSDENPTLNLFKGSSPWGYSNFSQPNSKYENISVTDPDGMIFDIPNNQVLQYSNGTWVVVSGQTPISAIGAGRLSYNSVTGKLFFCTGTDIIQIGKNTDI